jgi:multidrug efflux pump subunit AcrA (membrane-fusion protein)
LVKVGDKVQARQAIAILDNRDRLFAELQKSQTQVKVAEARLVQMRSQKFMKPILIKFVSIAPLVKK